MFDVDKIRADFPILSRKVHGKDLVYLDSGATAQKPISVIEKVNYLHTEMNANVHRGIHFLSEECTSEYEAAREEIKGFIGARSSREIVFTSGATAAINLVAYSYGQQNISVGDNIIITEMEHHSNIIPWQMLCQRTGAELRVLPFDDDGRLKTEILPDLIDSRTRILAITQASNVLGTIPDLKPIIELAHAAGAVVLVDGCQGIVHSQVDVAELDCDFYAFSGHKLYAPTGIGVLYGKEALLDAMPPFMGGGDMVATVSFAKTTYAQLPLKFEAGTSNYIGAIGLGEAVKYIKNLDRKEVEAHERALTSYATQVLEAIPGVRIYGNQSDKCSIVSFTVDGTHPYDLGMIVDKMGVAIRTGSHCAEPLMTHYGITSMARASFAMYNTINEIDALAEAVIRAQRMLT